MLNVAAGIFRARQTERFAAEKRHGFGLDLPQVAGRLTSVAELDLRTVS